jgi:hypothetical protein
VIIVTIIIDNNVCGAYSLWIIKMIDIWYKRQEGKLGTILVKVLARHMK